MGVVPNEAGRLKLLYASAQRSVLSHPHPNPPQKGEGFGTVARISLRHVLIAALLALASPTLAQVPATCPAGGQLMTSVTLFFGLAIPGGGQVSEADFAAFLDADVTPRFPEGFSVLAASGQWRDAAKGAIVREPSRALMIWRTPSEQADAAVEAIRDAYKARFRQDSVMRVDDLDCVDF